MNQRLAVMLVAALTCPLQLRAEATLTLDESKQLALTNNARTKNSALALDAAVQTRKAAITSYFPTVSASGSIFRAQKPLMEMSTAGGNLPVYDGDPAHIPGATQYAYFPSSTTQLLKSGTIGMVTAVQPLFAGGRILNGNRLAALGEDVGGYQDKLARNEVLLKTEEQYWQIVSLDDKLTTIGAYEALLNRLRLQVEDALASGIAMKNDLLKVKLKQNEVLLNKVRLENGRRLAALSFCQYVGIPYDSSLVLASRLTPSELPQVYYVDNLEALGTRPEYRLLQSAVRAAELESNMKLGEYLPQVGVGVAGLYLKLDENQNRKLGMVFGTVSVPISGWWEASHTLTERGIREEIAHNNLKENGELLLLQMEKAWADLNVAYKQVLLSEEARAQAAENLSLNQDSYKNGLTSVADLLEAQALAQQAADQLTDARVGYRMQIVRYLQVTGR